MKRFSVFALPLAAVLAVGSARADELPVFGALQPMSPQKAREQAEAWLKESGKADAGTLAKFAAIWSQDGRTILDRLGETFALASPEASKLLTEARSAIDPAPTAIPDFLKDAKQPAFFRANLALAYARQLTHRRVHEEALDVLKLVRPEQVIDPAAYLFYRAVSEHSLLNKEEATRTISRLLDEVTGSPERYKTVSALMLLDMQTWRDKDLAAIARKMENVERRLELARGGPKTQKLQKEIVARLDELIKELENKAKQKGNPPPGGS